MPVSPSSPTNPALSDESIDAAYASNRRTLLRCNTVMSLDGATVVDGSSRPLSSETDLRVLKHLRDCADAVLVGAGTLRSENYPPLHPSHTRQEKRTARGLSPLPTLVIATRSGEGLAELRALRDAPRRPIVLAPHTLPAHQRQELHPLADLLLHGEKQLDLRSAVHDLHTRGVHHIVCEGGPSLLGSLLCADLIDEWCVTISPWLAQNGSSLHTAQLSTPRKLALTRVLTTSAEVFLRYTECHN